MAKFGDAHGAGNKITAGAFDSTQRRMISAGSDGSVKIWNFSNGECLKNMLGDNKNAKVDRELTTLISIHDPDVKEEERNTKMTYFAAVGWDRQIHIWPDDKSEESHIERMRELPGKSSDDSKKR